MQMTQDNDRIAAEAADWFIANQADEPMDADQRRRFAQWLDASPRHAEEYLEIAQLGPDLSKTAALAGLSVDVLVERARDADDSNDGSAQVLAFASRVPREKASLLRRNPWLPFAAAAAFVMVALVLTWNSGLRPDAQVKEARFASGHGQLVTQPLQDGSVLQLNTDSVVTVRYSTTERRIDVERGQAVFTVKHEMARPFRVFAGDARILDIGTKFDVYLQPDATVRVTVLEGQVEVGSQRSAGKLNLVAGQQVRVRAGELPSAALDVDVESETAYLNRQIVVLNKPLASVVDEFNRYIPVPIQIVTPQLRQLKISGSFPVDDVGTLLAHLRMQEGVRVEVTPARILVSRI